jgi:hypothetical protein
MKASTIIFSALLAAGSAIAAVTERGELASEWDPTSGLTKEQLKAFNDIIGEDTPECADKCTSDIDMSSVMPLCAQTDQDNENLPAEDYINAYSCICTDKIYLNAIFSCVMKGCAGNAEAIERMFGMEYVMCSLYGKTNLPKPATFLEEICIDKAGAPAALKLLEDGFKYSYAKSIPPTTATTYITKWAATQTAIPKTEVAAALKETRAALTCAAATGTAAVKSGSKTTSAGAAQQTNENGTTNGNGTNGGDAGSAAPGLAVGGSVWAMAIGAGFVGVLALAL